ncbi:hypothetical protein Y032_0117g658 [Ancylostoma ceylanicum]|uniref:Uncharacterized protein n=1 Tax=Ancylostoma ceylanicum TaxID=53326 RepID=A0A016TC14_9BILA|nr:hypothetical protein Y032_0117g658 [Ancylostoma ceylanicum]
MLPKNYPSNKTGCEGCQYSSFAAPDARRSDEIKMRRQSHSCKWVQTIEFDFTHLIFAQPVDTCGVISGTTCTTGGAQTHNYKSSNRIKPFPCSGLSQGDVTKTGPPGPYDVLRKIEICSCCNIKLEEDALYLLGCKDENDDCRFVRPFNNLTKAESKLFKV